MNNTPDNESPNTPDTPDNESHTCEQCNYSEVTTRINVDGAVFYYCALHATASVHALMVTHPSDEFTVTYKPQAQNKH